MSYFLLSDTTNPSLELSKKLDFELSNIGPTIAYISSSPQNNDKPWFHNTWNEYKSICKDVEMKYFDLSDKFNDNDLKSVLKFKVMHLSGGNTYQFLKYIRERNFELIIKEFVANGGLLIGVSAGAILMTPTIAISETANDTNESDLKDLNGLNFVPFEIYPHFKNTQDEIDKITKYSENSDFSIYILDDSSGIFVNEKNTELF